VPRHYRAYCLTLAVPFACPELPAAEPDAVPDVRIEPGAVPRALPAPTVRELAWDAAPGAFLVRGGRRAGRFLVRAGHVTVELNPEADERRLARCLVADVLPALLRLRGRLVLHAGGVLTPAGAVVIAGVSGAGKSTTLAALVRQGVPMFSDDVVVLALDPHGAVSVLPGVPEIALTPAAISGLALQPDPRVAGTVATATPATATPATATPAYPSAAKATVATRDALAAAPAEVRAVCVLDPSPHGEPALRALDGAEKLEALQASVFGPMLPAEHAAAFATSRALLGRAPMYRLTRPVDRWTTERVAELVLSAGGVV
jgi:hypothetical protein